MGRKPKVSAEIKLEAVLAYKNNEGSYDTIADRYGIASSVLRSWTRKFNSKGEEGLLTLRKNARISEDIKIMAVEDYKNGVGSLNHLCSKYNISSPSVLLNWIKKYDNHEEFNKRNYHGGPHMSKGRKTTFEERVEIVTYCINHDDDYNKTCDKYKVSYPQVYKWVKKYKEYGEEGLVDRRGKKNSPLAKTDQEKEIAELKRQLLLEHQRAYRLQMENDFLKKVKELGRKVVD